MIVSEHINSTKFFSLFVGVCVGVALLHLIGFLFPNSLNWGFHFLGFLTWQFTATFCLLFVALLFLFYQTDIEKEISRLASFYQAKPFAILFASFAFLLVFAFVFRVKASLLGDSFTIINNYQEYEQGLGPLAPWHEPFSMFFFYFAIKIFSTFTYPELFWSFLSVELLLGFVFLTITFLLVRQLFTEPRQQLLTFLFCMAFPYMIFFFGYIEIYAFSFVMLALFTLISVMVMRRKLPFFLAPVMYVFLTFSHYVNGVLLISVLYLTYLEYQEKRFTQIALGLGATGALVLIIFALVQFDITRLMNFSPMSHQLSLSEDISLYNDYSQAYTVFSFYHFTDILNYLILMSPLPIFVIGYYFLKQKRNIINSPPMYVWFLTALLPIFVYYFIAKLEQGNADDWDVFASHFFLLNLLAALFFFQIKPSQESKVFGLLIGMSFLFTLPWLTLNAKTDESIKRFQSLSDSRNVSHLGQYTMALRLTRYYNAINDTVHQPDVWQRYRNNFPDDPRGYANELMFLDVLSPENHQRKVQVYEQWFELNPWNPAMRHGFLLECMNVGTKYFNNGKLDSAQYFYSKALMLDSTQSKAYNNLGSVYAERGVLDRAIVMFTKATMFDSTFSDAYFNLGMAYEDSGRKIEARQFIQRAAELGNVSAQQVVKESQ